MPLSAISFFSPPGSLTMAVTEASVIAFLVLTSLKYKSIVFCFSSSFNPAFVPSKTFAIMPDEYAA